jgi:hypothetical protein
MELEQLLAGRNLSAMVEGVKGGLPRRIPDAFFQRTDSSDGNTAEWIEVDGNRQMARIVAEGSPARRVGHRGGKLRTVKMLRTFESQNFTGDRLKNLIDPQRRTRDNKGRRYVREQSQWFRQRFDNLIQATVQNMLLNFELHYDEDGSLLTSGSGALVSIDPAVPAGHQNQLDILGDGDIIDASWATTSTDIVAQLDAIKEAMLKDGGWPVVHAFYGKNIPGYVFANDAASKWISGDPALAREATRSPNSVPTGFQDIQWHKASDAFFVDASGDAQQLLGDDEIVFTPEPSPEWWGYFEGTEMVPAGPVQKRDNAEQALADLTEVTGFFSYAEVNFNPPEIVQYAGLNFLPVIKAPKAVAKADVTP